MSIETLPRQLGSVAGQALHPGQVSYLEGWFAGLQNRGFRFTDVSPNPVPATPKEPDDLIFEEKVKRDAHPLDAYPLLCEHASRNAAPNRENLFRFKWHGLFHLSPHTDAYMARLRIPAGQLKSFQARELAGIAAELTTGYIQVTTRANLQLRLIAPKDAPALLQRVQAIGLHTRGAGADNVRNLTASATAGIDPWELIDTGPLCHELAQLILQTRDFYDLPRKFNIALDGGGLVPTVEETNDIGFKAVAVTAPDETIEAGVYFRVLLGGATGHKAFARDLGVLVRPGEVVRVAAALLRVYLVHGNRTDRKKARLKHLLETWSLERYRTATEELLGFTLLCDPLGADGSSARIPLRDLPTVAHPHIGVHPQKQMGLFHLGVALPAGQLTSRQLLRLAEMAEQYGNGELRLTVWQNVIIPNLHASALPAVQRALEKMGLHWRQSHVRSGLIACTGNSYCKFAAADTKGHALALAEYLEQRLELDQPINIHLTGCPNSCAQHYMGDIGLLGTKVKQGDATLEGYHVFVGGGFGRDQGIGRQLFAGVPALELPATLERLLNVYQARRLPKETFQAFTCRHDLDDLKQMVRQGVEATPAG